MVIPSAEDIYLDEEPEVARSLLLQRAASGDPDAEFYLGHLAEEESPPNREHALQWYMKAAAAGHLEATHWAASFTYFGMGTVQDVDTAISMFRSCAEAGLDASQWKLGQHLLSVPGRREEGLGWLLRAAAQGHTGAIELLASERRSDDA
jgi:TPR repeat protein